MTHWAGPRFTTNHVPQGRRTGDERPGLEEGISPARLLGAVAMTKRDEPTQPYSISEIDIWRCANLLIQQHGTDALLRAAERADVLIEAGDMNGRRVWLRILAAKELLSNDRPASTPVH